MQGLSGWGFSIVYYVINRGIFPCLLDVQRTCYINSVPMCVHKLMPELLWAAVIPKSLCNASAQLRCNCTWEDDCAGIS